MEPSAEFTAYTARSLALAPAAIEKLPPRPVISTSPAVARMPHRAPVIDELGRHVTCAGAPINATEVPSIALGIRLPEVFSIVISSEASASLCTSRYTVRAPPHRTGTVFAPSAIRVDGAPSRLIRRSVAQ